MKNITKEQKQKMKFGVKTAYIWEELEEKYGMANTAAEAAC